MSRQFEARIKHCRERIQDAPARENAPSLCRYGCGLARPRPALGPCVAPKLFVDPRRDQLLAHIVPVDLDLAIGIEGVRPQVERPLGVILAHYQVDHGVVQGVMLIRAPLARVQECRWTV
jgi:hypothetical protein